MRVKTFECRTRVSGLNNRRKGTTFVELMVVLTLFSALLYCSFLLLDRGITMYRESADALEVRQFALLGISRLSSELRDTVNSSIHVDDTGLVFTSARNTANLREYNTVSGNPKWQKYICYFLGPLETGDTRKLLRTEEHFPSVDTFAPDPSGGVPGGTDTPRTPEFYAADSTYQRRIVARRVEKIELEKTPELVKIALTLTLSGRYKHSVTISTETRPTN